jgi:hypothetical protein
MWSDFVDEDVDDKKAIIYLLAVVITVSDYSE